MPAKCVDQGVHDRDRPGGEEGLLGLAGEGSMLLGLSQPQWGCFQACQGASEINAASLCFVSFEGHEGQLQPSVQSIDSGPIPPSYRNLGIVFDFHAGTGRAIAHLHGHSH